jgi:ATP-dependent Clp protease ATP-binding subunit ClpC
MSTLGREYRAEQLAEIVTRMTDRARSVILLADREAKRRDHRYIGTEHLLLGIVAEGEGIAAGVLAQLGVEQSIVDGVDFVVGKPKEGK